MGNLENKNIISEPEEKMEKGFICREVKITGDERKFLTDYENGKLMRFVYTGDSIYLGDQDHSLISQAAGSERLDGCVGKSDNPNWREMCFGGARYKDMTLIFYESRSALFLKHIKESQNLYRADLYLAISQRIYERLNQINYGQDKI